jgi:hypothetical protein
MIFVLYMFKIYIYIYIKRFNWKIGFGVRYDYFDNSEIFRVKFWIIINFALGIFDLIGYLEDKYRFIKEIS